MIDAALQAMRPDAYLINTARGVVVDEAALLVALKENWIGAAGLDPFHPEPLPPDSPFWSLPNVFVTPHCSGFSAKVVEHTIALFLNNLGRYRAGKLLRNVVDKTAG